MSVCVYVCNVYMCCVHRSTVVQNICTYIYIYIQAGAELCQAHNKLGLVKLVLGHLKSSYVRKLSLFSIEMKIETFFHLKRNLKSSFIYKIFEVVFQLYLQNY